MFNAERLVRSHIMEMPAYEPIHPFEVLSQQLGFPADQIVKLDANENPYGALPAVAETLATFPYSHIYPDPESRILRLALANFHNLPIENILVGAGADELIDLLLRLLVDPGDYVINCPPTFGMYIFDADLNQAQTISIPRLPDFSLDMEAIISAVQTHHPKLIFVASPNNPDGGLIPDQKFAQLLKLPILIILDEAYVEFAMPDSSRIQDVLVQPNLVVLRTFSKWAGLAGLRVGYGVFPCSLMPHLWKIKQPYNISASASIAASVSLKNADQLHQVGQRIIAERDRLYAELIQIPWLNPYPSQANFILCRVLGKDAAQVKNHLASRGILVRYFNKPGLKDHIRISVGKPEHTQALIETLKDMESSDENI